MSDAPASPAPEEPEKPLGLLRRFGSRNHPDAKPKATMQKARAGMAVSDETIANYTAARGFLYGEWFGASLMLASVALVYILAGCPKDDVGACQPGAGGSSLLPTGISLAMFAVGCWIYWSNHVYYKRLDFPWAKRWDTAAIVVAGSGAVFWLLFGVILGLTWMGVRVLPAA